MARSATTPRQYSFQLVPPGSIEALVTELAERAELIDLIEPTMQRCYHDSFDWRLLRAGGQLWLEREEVDEAAMLSDRLSSSDPTPAAATADLVQGQGLVPERSATLVWQQDGPQRRRIRLSDQTGIPRFASSFPVDSPAGVLRDLLLPLLDIRALLPRLCIRSQARLLRLLDDERKTVVRLRIEQNQLLRVDGRDLDPLPLATRVELQGVRGYRDELARVVAWCLQHPALRESGQSLVHEAFAHLGADEGFYSPRLNFQFAADQSDRTALVEVCQFLQGVMRRNLQGVIEDIDSEFLHDFRVAVRRTRAALGFAAGVFPKKSRRHFRERFAWLGGITGPTRDLDVYLLHFQDYLDTLRPEFRDDLEPLRDFLERHQREEQERLARELKSREFINLMEQWDAFLQRQGATESDGPISVDAPQRESETLETLAGHHLQQLWQQVLDDGRAIDAESPSEALHDLRKRCKRLRYLLEFFASIWTDDGLPGLIHAVKQLLDILGAFQDFEVQADKLREFARQMVTEGQTPAETLLAMGMLVDDLLRRQQQKRDTFLRHFADFAGPGNRARVAVLVGTADARETG